MTSLGPYIITSFFSNQAMKEARSAFRKNKRESDQVFWNFFFCALVQFMVTFFVVYKTDSSWLKLPKSFFLHVAWLMAVVSLFIYEKHNKIVISTHLPCSHTSLWPHLYYQPRTKQKVTVWSIINARDKWALHDQGGY